MKRLFVVFLFLAMIRLFAAWDTGPLVKVKDSQTLIVGDTEILLPVQLSAWKRDDGTIQLNTVDSPQWRPEQMCNKDTQKVIGIDSYGKIVCGNESSAPVR